MKAYETVLFGLTLIAVPALAWTAGRAMGRRDWRISFVVAMACLSAALPHALRFAVLAGADGRPFADALDAQLRRASDNVEVGLFFVALSVFVTMLGWTSTPVAVKQ